MSMVSENNCLRNTRLRAGTKLVYRSCYLAGSRLWWLSAQCSSLEKTLCFEERPEAKDRCSTGPHVKNPKAKGLALHSSPITAVGMGLVTRHVSRPQFPHLSDRRISTCPPNLPALLCLNIKWDDTLGMLYKIKDVQTRELSRVGLGVRLPY